MVSLALSERNGSHRKANTGAEPIVASAPKWPRKRPDWPDSGYPRENDRRAETYSSRTRFLRKLGFSTCLRRRIDFGVTSTSSSSSM